MPMSLHVLLYAMTPISFSNVKCQWKMSQSSIIIQHSLYEDLNDWLY